MRIVGGVRRFIGLEHGSDHHDAVSIALAEAADSSAVWHLEVWAHTDEGQYLLGQFDTYPAGKSRSRIVAIAACPGVREWQVHCFCADPSAVADLCLADGESGGAFGLTVLETQPAPPPADPSPPTPIAWSTAIAQPGTYYFPSAAGLDVVSEAISVLIKTNGGRAAFSLEISHDDFTHTAVDCTASALDVSSLAAPYAAVHVLENRQTQLDLDKVRAVRFRIKAQVQTACALTVSAIEGR